MQLTEKAKKLYDAVEKGTEPNDMKGKMLSLAEEMSPGSDCFCYNLYEGGYINPSDFLVGEDLEKVNEAIKVLGEFKKLIEKITLVF